MMWRTRGRERQAYNFSYDFLDRLRSAVYADVNDAGTATQNSRYNESLTYADHRGNIATLKRQGGKYSGTCWDFGQIDNLTYSYTSNTNKISGIADAASSIWNSKGFNPGGGTGNYAYDVNGNMTTDPYKNMTVQYNHLNLPKLMTFAGGAQNNTIEILYDAAGTKLRKTVKTGATTNYTQDYIGGIEYRDGVREAIYNAEGRVYYTSPTVTRYEYTIKDHLGNSRLSFTDKDANGVVEVTNTTANEVLQENHYYPFGLNTEGPWMNDAILDNKYQYNIKEWNDDFGLNWNDYGARWYDAAVGRWIVTDPLSGKNRSASPFNYCLNRPVNFIDLFGLEAYTYNWGTGQYHNESGEVVSWDEVQSSLNSSGNSSSNDAAGPPHRWKKTVDENGNEHYEYVNDDGGDETDYVDNYDCDGNFCHTDEMQVNKSVSNDVRNVMVAPGVRVGYGTTPAEFEAILWIFGGKALTWAGGRLLAGSVAKGVTNLVPQGKLANHLFKGAGKLADNPANRTLIQNISNGKALVVDKFGKSWYRGVDATGQGIYSYAQNGIVKGAGYTNLSAAEIIAKYGVK